MLDGEVSEELIPFISAGTTLSQEMNGELFLSKSFIEKQAKYSS
jgi:hypothetical protein